MGNANIEPQSPSAHRPSCVIRKARWLHSVTRGTPDACERARASSPLTAQNAARSGRLRSNAA
eukprot:6923606-Pyramimonas_sp.AAC.1